MADGGNWCLIQNKVKYRMMWVFATRPVYHYLVGIVGLMTYWLNYLINLDQKYKIEIQDRADNPVPFNVAGSVKFPEIPSSLLDSRPVLHFDTD